MYRDPYELRAELRKKSIALESFTPITHGHRGALIGAMNKVLSSEEDRKIILAWLFSYNGSGENPLAEFRPMSSSMLSNGQWLALAEWVGSYKDENDGGWHSSDQFKAEIMSVARLALPMYYNMNNIAYDDLLDVPTLEAELLMMGGTVTYETIEDTGEGLKYETRFFRSRRRSKGIDR